MEYILENVNFKKLKELSIYDNIISDISVFKKIKFDNLEILKLDKNKISNIDILSNANFKKIKELYLSYNNISDISILEKVDFEELEMLDLEGNKINKNKFYLNHN